MSPHEHRQGPQEEPRDQGPQDPGPDPGEQQPRAPQRPRGQEAPGPDQEEQQSSEGSRPTPQGPQGPERAPGPDQGRPPQENPDPGQGVLHGQEAPVPGGQRPRESTQGPHGPAPEPGRGEQPPQENHPGGEAPEGSQGAPQDQIPAGDWSGLHPLSVWANAAVGALIMVPVAVVATVVLALTPLQWWWALLPIPLTAALLAATTYVDMLRLRAVRYRVTEERMEMRSGLVAKAYRSIPRERVRTVDVTAPLHVRLFGLCTVTVGTGESAGAGGSDQLQLQFVTAEQGDRLRHELLQRGPSPTAGAPGQEGTDGRGTDHERELARLDPRWFAYAPATTATIGIGFGFLATLSGIVTQVSGGAWEWLSSVLGLPSGSEIGAFVLGQLLAVVSTTLLALLLIGVVATLAVAVETWWNYRLVRQGDGTVRLRRGLLNSVSLSVEGRRLNGVLLREPLILRSVGGAEVRAVATGLSAGDEQKTAAKSRLSPAMPGAKARGLAAALLQSPDSPLEAAPHAHPRAALRRRFTRAGLATLAAVAVAGALTWVHGQVARLLESSGSWSEHVPSVGGGGPAWGWFVAAALFGASAFWYAVGSYRGLGHGTHPRHLVVRHGMAVRNTVALERSAVIGWRITRSPFQRRLGLADVSATTAAGEGLYTATDVGLGQGLAWAQDSVPELLAPFLESTGDGGEDPGDGDGGGEGTGRSVLF